MKYQTIKGFFLKNNKKKNNFQQRFYEKIKTYLKYGCFKRNQRQTWMKINAINIKLALNKQEEERKPMNLKPMNFY